jgi:hypothetical protein
VDEAEGAAKRESPWRRFWQRRDPTPLLLLSLIAVFWLAAPGAGKLWHWHGQWRVGQAMDAVKPVQAMVESTAVQDRSCPELFLRDGSTLSPAIRRVHVTSRIYPPYCSIQIDFKGDVRTHIDGERVFLVWKDGQWACIPPAAEHFPAIAHCTSTREDLL